MSTELIKSTIFDLEDQIKSVEKDYKYRLVEWPIEVLVKKFVSKKDAENYKEILEDNTSSVLIVPKYQRDYIWDDKMKSKLIESLFMKVPMAPLFAFTLDDEGNLELIDGVQRLSTINEFVKDEHTIKDLEVLTCLNGYKFSELDPSRQRKFNSLSLKLYMLDEETDEGVRADIFNRINSTGKKLEPAEIRKGSFLGNPFYDFILGCTGEELFCRLFSSTKDDDKLRGEKEELISRFFAYSEKYLEFDHSVKGFIDDYIKSKKNIIKKEIEEKKDEFIRALHFIESYFPYGFRKTENAQSIPKVRFEAIAIGVNLALRQNPEIKNPELRWLESNEFKKLTTSDAANNKSKLIGRIEFVRDCLLRVIDDNTLTYES